MIGAAWTVGLAFVLIYCIVQAVRDFRRGASAMAAAGIVCAVVLLLVPIKSQAVKVDIIGPESSP